MPINLNPTKIIQNRRFTLTRRNLKTEHSPGLGSFP
jgi:hypothetical protein